MTDLLEELLALGDEDREDVAEELLRAAYRKAAPVRREKISAAEAVDGARALSEEKPVRRELRQRLQLQFAPQNGERTDRSDPQALYRPNKVQTEQTEQTARRSPLLQQLQLAQRAAEARFSPAGVLERPYIPLVKRPAAETPDRVRQVDRAFERDARRYDCGFTLY